jgi:hypothetical protein
MNEIVPPLFFCAKTFGERQFHQQPTATTAAPYSVNVGIRFTGEKMLKGGLKTLFLKIIDDKLSVASFIVHCFLAFAFFFVFFLTFDAEPCERKDLQTPELDLAFAALADSVRFVFNAFERLIDGVKFVAFSIIQDEIYFAVSLVAR